MSSSHDPTARTAGTDASSPATAGDRPSREGADQRSDGTDPTGPRPPSSEGGVADLIGRLSDQFTTLLRQEVELAKAEAKQEAATAAKAGVEFGAAGLAGFLALLFLSFAAAWGLSDVLEEPSWGFVIVGLIYAIGAAVAAMKGRKDAKQVDPSLPKTKRSLQTTAEWAKDKP